MMPSRHFWRGFLEGSLVALGLVTVAAAVVAWVYVIAVSW